MKKSIFLIALLTLPFSTEALANSATPGEGPLPNYILVRKVYRPADSDNRMSCFTLYFRGPYDHPVDVHWVQMNPLEGNPRNTGGQTHIPAGQEVEGSNVYVSAGLTPILNGHAHPSGYN